MSVNEKIKEDVEALFLKILTRDFEDVPIEERDAFKGIWGVLVEAYKEQFRNALLKANNSINVFQRTRYKNIKQ